MNDDSAAGASGVRIRVSSAASVNSNISTRSERREEETKSLARAEAVLPWLVFVFIVSETVLMQLYPNILLRIYNDDAVASSKTNGVITSVEAVMQVIIVPSLVSLSDQLGRVPVVQLSLLVGALTSLALGLDPASLGLMIFTRVMGSSLSLVFPIAQAIISDMSALSDGAETGTASRGGDVPPVPTSRTGEGLVHSPTRGDGGRGRDRRTEREEEGLYQRGGERGEGLYQSASPLRTPLQASQQDKQGHMGHDKQGHDKQGHDKQGHDKQQQRRRRRQCPEGEEDMEWRQGQDEGVDDDEEQKRRATTLAHRFAVMGAVFGLSITVGPVLAGLLLRVNMLTPCLVAAGLKLVGLVLARRYLPETAEGARVRAKAKAKARAKGLRAGLSFATWLPVLSQQQTEAQEQQQQQQQELVMQQQQALLDSSLSPFDASVNYATLQGAGADKKEGGEGEEGGGTEGTLGSSSRSGYSLGEGGDPSGEPSKEPSNDSASSPLARPQLKFVNPFVVVKTLGETRKLFVVSCIYTCYLLALGGYSQMYLYLDFRFDWDPTLIGLFFSFLGLVLAAYQGVLLRFLVPRLLSQRQGVYWGLGLQAVSSICYGLAWRGWMLYIVCLVTSVYTLSDPCLQAFLAKAVLDPRGSGGRLQGALTVLRSLTQIVAGPLFARAFAWGVGSNHDDKGDDYTSGHEGRGWSEGEGGYYQQPKGAASTSFSVSFEEEAGGGRGGGWKWEAVGWIRGPGAPFFLAGLLALLGLTIALVTGAASPAGRRGVWEAVGESGQDGDGAGGGEEGGRGRQRSGGWGGERERVIRVLEEPLMGSMGSLAFEEEQEEEQEQEMEEGEGGQGGESHQHRHLI